MFFASRPMPRLLRDGIRGALTALCLLHMPLRADAGDEITSARFLGETTLYPHEVLGDKVEFTTLRIVTERGAVDYNVAPDHVFEDLEPRLWNIDAQPGPEVVTVLSSVTQGASLAVFNADGLLARTPFIGRKNRWLAPIAAVDLDGDGTVEIAYIDRPHLAKTLRVWRLNGGQLVEVASAQGLTNHRIGDAFIQSGWRDCGKGPELVTVDADWQHIVATRFDGTNLHSREIAEYRGPDSVKQTLACRGT